MADELHPAPLTEQIDTVSLRDHIAAILDEQRRGMLLAAEEREKAAQALRVELERSITQGDLALREHIKAQVDQIRAALVSAELLELQRFDSLKVQMGLITDSAQIAINKLAEQYEKRFEQINEFRAQLSDQTQSFLPREVAETQFAELRRVHAELTEKVGKLA